MLRNQSVPYHQTQTRSQQEDRRSVPSQEKTPALQVLAMTPPGPTLSHLKHSYAEGMADETTAPGAECSSRTPLAHAPHMSLAPAEIPRLSSAGVPLPVAQPPSDQQQLDIRDLLQASMDLKKRKRKEKEKGKEKM